MPILILMMLTLAFASACRTISYPTSRLNLINGLDAPKEHPEVVRIDILYASGKKGWCSGTFVAPSSLMTAAHCLFDREGDPISKVIYRDHHGRNHSGALFPSSSYRPKIERDEMGFSSHRDLAMVGFEEDIAPAIAKVAEVSPEIGEEVVLVGFGNDNAMSNSGGRVKRMGSNRIEDNLGNLLDIRGEIAPTSDSSKRGLRVGIAEGDSGGAMFNKKGELVGVISSFAVISDRSYTVQSQSIIVNLAHKQSRKMLFEITQNRCAGAAMAPSPCPSTGCTIF